MAKNAEIAEKFYKLANLLDIEGDNPFRIRAYRNAARVIAQLSQNVEDIIAEGKDLTDLPGIGKDLAEKIILYVKTGQLPILTQIEARTPPILNELMQIEGLGPTRVGILYKKLKIHSVDDLKLAIEKGRLRKLVGFGEKTEQKILQGISAIHTRWTPISLIHAFPIATALIAHLKQIKALELIECAGSFRRRKEVVADLDIVVAGKNAEAIIAHFVNFKNTVEILSQGTTRSTIRLRDGMQVDLRVVDTDSFGAALLYFTGSKEHNIAIRKMAVQKKLKINEYGVFKGKKWLAGRTEADVYAQVGLPYIEPELREDRGEIKAAQEHKLPNLITLADIRGDLHCKTNSKMSLETLAKVAETYGYEYIAITDKLDKKALLAQIKAIDKINAKLKKLVILKGVEVDILANGKLSLPNDVLKELDLTLCSLNSQLQSFHKKQTERIIKAMDNPYFTILAHPTGRIINQPPTYAINIEPIIHAAKEQGCILELNAQPNRLDLNDIHSKMAKEIGTKITVSTGAETKAQLDFMEFGVFQARRGWLEKEDVVNTLPLANLLELLHR